MIVCMHVMYNVYFLFSISLWNNENSSHMWVTHFLRSAGYRYVKKLRSLLSSHPRRHAATVPGVAVGESLGFARPGSYSLVLANRIIGVQKCRLPCM